MSLFLRFVILRAPLRLSMTGGTNHRLAVDGEKQDSNQSNDALGKLKQRYNREDVKLCHGGRSGPLQPAYDYLTGTIHTYSSDNAKPYHLFSFLLFVLLKFIRFKYELNL